MQVVIVGGGAAGCFAAIHIRRKMPSLRVTLVEAAPRLLSKVAVTGGGRCNLTNSFAEVRSLESVYPRGARLMKRLFNVFDYKDAYRWFENEGVRLVVQEDQCVFPASQQAQQIVGVLVQGLRESGVEVLTSHRISRIDYTADAEKPFILHFSDERYPVLQCDCVLSAMGGSPREEGLKLFADLSIPVESPVPSLFSFCVPDISLTSLMGTVVEDVSLRLIGTKLRSDGALLLTHWGMSGPAALKLSSYAARVLADKNYCAQISINWMGNIKEEEIVDVLQKKSVNHLHKQLSSVYPEILNARLWQHLLLRSGLQPERRWGELGRKGFGRLAATLANDIYNIEGKNRFKDEFVTCGGVALSGIDLNSLESRVVPGLFFAGEVLDVDAVTGGFNLQAAWTTGYVAAEGIISKLSK